LPGTITANVTTTAQYADSATPGAPSVTGVTPTRSTTPTWSWVSGGGGNGTFRHQLDGAAGTWTETTATSFTPAAALPDGTHALYVQERNTVGNWSASGVFSIVVDTVPPTVTGLADDDTPTRSKTWTWGATKEIVTYRHGIDTNPVGVPSGDYGAVTSATQATGDGAYYLHVQAKDDAGNESGVVTVHAVLDNTAPAAPAVTGSGLVHTATPTWTWTGGGGGNGTFRCQIDGTAGAWTQTTALSFTAAAALSDGLHALYVEERDTAGNWSAAGSFATEVDAYCFVRYSAEGGGTLTGNADQVVPYGGSTTAVTVTATAGHAFWGWNDGSMDNPRSDTNVTTDRLIVATFIDIVPPAGEFQAAVEQDAVGAGQGWWDFTGHYATTVQDLALELDLVHDTAGRLNGTGTCGLDKDGAIPVLIRGNVCGRAGSVVATLMLRNAEPAAGTTVMLSMVLTLDADSASLVGPVNGSVTVSDAKYAVDTTATLSLPEGMDGTWTLSFSLSQVADDVMGTAVLLLSNATEYSFEVRGMATDQAAVLALAGDPADPAARGIRIRTTITPLEGGQATLDVFSGTGYGQALAW